MIRRRYLIPALILPLLIVPVLYSAHMAHRAQSEARSCPAQALESIDQARRWAPWSDDHQRAQTQLALQLGDYAALRATRRWWANDGGDGDFLRRAARIEWGLAGHPIESELPAFGSAAESCTDQPIECALWRASRARWLLHSHGDYDAAQAALGWSLVQCSAADCAAPAWPVLQQALQMAWRYRSARGLVHQWMARPDPGLPTAQVAPWTIRVALDRRDLVEAARLFDAHRVSECPGPTYAADQALLEASIRLRQERYADTHRSIERAASYARVAEDARGERRLLPFRAYLAMRQRRWQEAAQMYAQLADSNDAWQQRDAWVGQANVHMHQGAYDLASDLYRQALARDDQLRSADPSFRMRTLSMLAQAALQQSDLPSAVAPIAQARDLAQRNGDTAAAVIADLAAADLYHRNGAHRQALQSINDALALELAGQREGASPFLSAQYDQALRRVYRLATDPEAARLRQSAIQTLWRLHRSMRQRPQRLRAQRSARPTDTAFKSRSQLQAALGPNRQLISYGYAADQAYALRLSTDDLRLIPLPAAPKRLEELAARWLTQLRRQQRITPEMVDRQLAMALHEALIAPLLADGMQPGDRLLINPVGALASLSWAALGSEVDGRWRYLIDDHDVQIVAAMAWLHTAQSVDLSAPVVIAAGDAPAHARAEAEWVAAQLRVDVHDGAELAESALVKVATKASWLHFSGHGVSIAEHPLQSYLGLSPPSAVDDGRWRVAEVLAQPVAAAVVVLGACESIQSNVGGDWTWYADVDMASAFVHAGAGSVVSSVLPAPDQATAALMRAYYRALGDGDSAHALAQAQRLLARSLPPSDWAGFRVTGGAL